MMKKVMNLKLGKRLWKVMKENKILSIASIVFLSFLCIDLILVYNFVQVLKTI